MEWQENTRYGEEDKKMVDVKMMLDCKVGMIGKGVVVGRKGQDEQRQKSRKRKTDKEKKKVQ